MHAPAPRISPAGGLPLRSESGEARIPALDGVRGVAVLMVMFLHLLPDAFWPVQPWLKRALQAGLGSGVDLFFVLSGFLITGILLETQNSPHYFRNFYTRRILRIFPLYYGALALVFGMLPALGALGGASFEAVRALSPWHWGYLSNVAWFLHPESLSAPQVELRHFWSLSVEEHFYLLWPLLVGFATPRGVRQLCVALFAGSLALRTGWTLRAHDVSLIAFLTPCRLDTLAAGAFLGALTRETDWRRHLPTAKTVGAAAALLLVFLVMAMPFRSATRSLSISLAAVLMACAIFILLARPSASASNRLLCSPLLTFFGRYSYGLYLIHGLLAPLLARLLPEGPWFAALGGSAVAGGLALAVVKIALITPLAMLSWHFYEKPFLNLKRFFR